MKYELTEDTMDVCGHTLCRVRYLADGALGGWIKSEKNLSKEGNACIFGDARVYGNAKVSGDVCVSGNDTHI
jgi:NDP-sugar pyrophosphorylase family protein